GGRATGAKVVLGVGRAPGRAGAVLRRRWLESPVPPALRSPAAAGCVTAVVEDRLGDAGPNYDGVATVRFAAEDAPRIAAGPVSDAEGTPFVDLVHAYRVDEYVERW